MKLFARTLTDFLIKEIRPMIMGQSGGKELRLFLASQPPQVIHRVASAVSEFLRDHPAQIQFEFKVGTALWQSWQENSVNHNTDAYLQKVDSNGWVDKEDKLTHYRNMKWEAGSGYDYLVIILVGVDLARDQASLHDFFKVDSKVIWESELKKTFEPWVRLLYQEQQEPVFAQDEQIEEAGELLKVLHKNGAGDLLRVSEFLEQLDVSGLPDGNEALMSMYGGLGFWDLPLLQEMSFRSRKRWTDYVKDAGAFFSYQNFLKSSERKRVLGKIELFQEKFDAGEEDYPLGAGEFTDVHDLLGCLREYVGHNQTNARSRLLKTDFAPVRDLILKARKKGPKKTPRPPAMTKIDTHPLGAVLNALWMVLTDFKKGCTQTNVGPAKVLKRIHIEGKKFLHDLDDQDDGWDLINGCLGGLDAFLKKNLTIEVEGDSEDEKQNIPIESKLLPDYLNHLQLGRAGAGSPGFQFEVVFQAEDDELSVRRKFQWQLPATQPYRTLWNLSKEVRRQMPEQGVCLPVFTVPFYDEIFLASDEEEANRILQLGFKKLRVENLFNPQQIDLEDEALLKLDLGELSHCFGVFLKSLEQDGYFAALEKPWEEYSRSYSRILTLLARDGQVGPKNQFAPLVYKAFSIIDAAHSKTPFAQFLPSAVLTGLHPTLLEMLRNRETFLVHGFLEKSQRILNDTSGLKITLQQWESVCDLADIKYPLFGLVADDSKRLDSTVKSLGLIHCIGSPVQDSAPLSAKILLRSDENNDEMSDSSLFRESRESRVVKRLLEEYVDVYPHARDGISLAVINPENIQTVISGIDAFLKDQLGGDDNLSSPPYHFSLVLLTLDSGQQEAARHLQEWRKRWEVVNESSSKFGYYHNCRLSIAHRVASNVNQGIKDYLKLASRDDFDADITMLINFITVGNMGNDVEQTDSFQVDLDHPLKFPIVEMPRCSDEHPSQLYVRAKVVSNRRFRLATLHSELGVYFKHPEYPMGREYIVISKGDYERWSELIDKLHEQSAWVFCLDSAMDERLAAGLDGVGRKREIIGFSSGLGFRGELNYTISTERSTLTEIEKEIAGWVSRLCGIKEQKVLEQSAHRLVAEARKLSGLSLVRATGPGERHIRELIASTLVRISLPDVSGEGLCLCDELVSLDAFIHWFESAGSSNRPDLLRVVAFLQDNGTVVVHTHMIECKLALKNSAHLEKARLQLYSGLQHLMAVFQPSCDGSGSGVFDQRYWWAQLQRLIASKSRVPSAQQQNVTHALELLGEGRFKICWRAMAVAFWTDSLTAHYEYVRSWDFPFEDRQLTIDVISAGVGIIVPLCNASDERIPCSSDLLCFPDEKSCDEQCPTEDGGRVGMVSSTQKDDLSENRSTESTGSSKEEMNSDPELLSGDKSMEEDSPEHVEPTSPDVNIDSDTIQERQDAEAKKKETVGIPDRITLGITLGGVKKEICWEFGHPKLTNRHFLIFGKSGVGKTYAIQAILMELARAKQNSVIVDYTSGFLKNHLEEEFKDIVNPTGHIVKQSPLPINPFKRQRIMIEDFEDIEDAFSVAGRITSVFTSVYSSFGEQQKALLHRVLEYGIESYGDGYDFGRLLEELEEEGSSTAVTVANKLTPLGRAKIFSGDEGDSWQQIYSDESSKVNVLQLAGLSRELANMATEFILWDLYDFARSQGAEERPLPIVLDEIQNLDHRLDSPLAKILTEGRKFGLSAILATQTLSNLPQEARDRLFMATHKLFFKPAETEMKEYSTILANATGDKLDVWKERLMKLGKGECYSFGPTLNTKTQSIEEKPFPIQITSLPDRLREINND